MANEKEQKPETAQKNEKPENVVPMGNPGKPEPKIEVRGFPGNCRQGLANYQNGVSAAVNQRDAFITGVAMNMGLDGTWQFDMNSFLNNRACRFVREVAVKEQKKEEAK